MTREKQPPGGMGRADASVPNGATALQSHLTMTSSNLSSPEQHSRANELSPESLLELILSKLDRGDAPDRKWPDSKGDYWTLCPFHPDGHHGSFHVGPRGYKCFVCGKGGSLRDLAKHLGIEVARLHAKPGGNTPPSPSLKLEEYA